MNPSRQPDAPQARCGKIWAAFRRARRGSVALEFAVLGSALVLLLIGGGDLSFWYMKKFRLDNTASAVGNIIAGASTLASTAFPANYCSSSSSTMNYFAAASQIAAPLVVCGTGGATIISGLSNNGATTTIVWQKRTGDAVAFPSLIGTVGAVPVLPSGYSVPLSHGLVATEVYTSSNNWSATSQKLLGVTGDTSIYSYSLFEPRSGTLVTPQ